MSQEIHRIAILSDTHGLLRPEIVEILKTCEAILHGGDINSRKTLCALEQIAPVYVVRGNNDKDWAEGMVQELEITLFGLHIYMIHNKKYRKAELSGTDVFIYGHSHKYEEREEDGVLFLNPGSCGPRRFGQPVTMAVLKVCEDTGQWQVENFCNKNEPILKLLQCVGEGQSGECGEWGNCFAGLSISIHLSNWASGKWRKMTKQELEMCIHEYGKEIYSFCKYLACSQQEADDLYQDTFLKAVELEEKIDYTDNIKSYLLSIALRIWKNRKRKAAWRKRIADVRSVVEEKDTGLFASSELLPEEQILDKEKKEMVRGAVNKLPERFRIVILLFYMEDLSVAQIASVLKIPAGTVKSRLFQARKLLKKELEDVLDEE